MKIQAKFEELNTVAGKVSYPITKCQHEPDIMVGSTQCKLCRYHEGMDCGIVTCDK